MRLPGISLRRALQCGVVAGMSGLVTGAVARQHEWNSDDVALQVAMRTWSPGHGTLYLPESTWLLRVPLYAVTEALFGSSPTTLAVQTITLNVASALMVFWLMTSMISLVSAETGRRPLVGNGWLAVLVTCWVVTVSPVVTDLLVRPANRSLDIGLVSIGLLLVARAFHLGTERDADSALLQQIRPFVLPAVWFGVLAVDDATAMYCLVGPVAIVAAIALINRRSRVARDALVLAGGAAAIWRIGLLLLRAMGIHTQSLNPRVIEASELPTTMANTADSLARIFDVPVFGATIHDLRLAVVVPQLALLTLSALALRHLSRSFWRHPIAAGAATWAIGLVAAFMLSSHGLSNVNIRYLVFGVVPIAALIAAAIAVVDRRPQRIMVGLVVLVFAVHLVDVVRTARVESSPNADSARLVEALNAADIQRGYGDFWETLRPSYFDRSLTLVPVLCVDQHQTAPGTWFVHSAIAEPDPTASRTGYIYSRRPGLGTCAIEDVMQQFGEPLETVEVTGDISLLIYEGDIGEQLAPAQPPT
jgi:hypothetical protein